MIDLESAAADKLVKENSIAGRASSAAHDLQAAVWRLYGDFEALRNGDEQLSGSVDLQGAPDALTATDIQEIDAAVQHLKDAEHIVEVVSKRFYSPGSMGQGIAERRRYDEAI